MRTFATLAVVLALGGCTRLDADLARVRAQVSLAGAPTSDADVGAVAACTNPYDVSFAEARRLTYIGGVTFADLGGTGEPWRYAPARIHARHLDRNDPIREEMLDNGADFHAAHLVHVVVPAGRSATITVDEPRGFPNVALLAGGVARHGGYTAGDGVLELRCEAGDSTTTFPVGVIVEWPLCASFTVGLDGGPSESRLVPFGRRSCP